MGFIKKCLLVSLGFGLAGAIGASFATGTAQALVAAMVQVANTSANPVPTSPVNVTDPGRIAYQSTVNNAGQCSGSICVFTFGPVPSGHRVVVQHIGGRVNLTTSPANIQIQIFSNNHPLITELLAAPAPSAYSFAAFDQTVLFYVDSGDNVTVQMYLDGNSATFLGGSVTQYMTLIGYELDCTVAACAPIAQ